MPPADTWGTFLDPDPALVDVESLRDELDIELLSGHRADLESFAGASPVFDEIAAAIAAADIACEDQCTGQHYFDAMRCVDLFRGSPAQQPRSAPGGLRLAQSAEQNGGAPRATRDIRRVVDVGVFMGGSASIFAGCVEPMGIELDLVDPVENYLQFTRERLRRTFPGAVARVRMFHGDLPTYVRDVLLAEQGVQTLVHHDGAHDFNQVVKDLASLYFVRDRVHGVAIQDTHLRCSTVELFNFVDSAVYAVFGADVRYEPLGTKYGADSPLVDPNDYQGQYFLAGEPEGMFIPLSQNEFRYPHPAMSLDDFLPARARERA